MLSLQDFLRSCLVCGITDDYSHSARCVVASCLLEPISSPNPGSELRGIFRPGQVFNLRISTIRGIMYLICPLYNHPACMGDLREPRCQTHSLQTTVAANKQVHQMHDPKPTPWTLIPIRHSPAGHLMRVLVARCQPEAEYHSKKTCVLSFPLQSFEKT